MPLSIRFDNRLDRLADALIERTMQAASCDPLALHPVIVPSVGVGRWLQQRVAQATGVCARLEPELPGRLLWRWLRELLPGLPARSPFEPVQVRWRLLAMFDALPDDLPELAPLRERVTGAPSRQRLAVASEVAWLFDRYLAWRRDWLERWQRGLPAAGEAGRLGPHEGWQRWLWLRLLESMPGLADAHPYERLERLLLTERDAVRRVLGGRFVSLFGMPDLSPAQFALFGLLGEVADVAFFAPDPCREWWEDLVDSRERARVLAQRPDQAWLYPGEPSVLGDWGRAQRDFVAQVAALQERFEVQASEPFRELHDPDGANDGGAPDCLHALRQSVFLRSDAPWARVPAADDSIVVHCAHSAIRQAEVLHDLLLECFERLPDLHPSEVAVFCADIDSAAPAIDAVFSTADPARRIPVAISGRPARTEPLLRAARELLELCRQGPTLPAIEAWLLNPAVCEASGMDADDVASLVRILDEAGARWGLDASDGALKHHWEGALDRLLIGAAVSGEIRLIGGIAPVQGLRGSRAALAGPLYALLAALRSLRRLATRECPVEQWCETFGLQVEILFAGVRRHEPALARLRDALADLAASAREAAAQLAPAPIDLSAFAFALDDALRASSPAASASGAVTVCPLGALRAVPFRVVFLFGLDEGVFPRRSARIEADLMARSPRFGDRSARIDDRGIFLDAVLAAQDRLAILFRGRDVRDDTPLDPSPVVLELTDWLRDRLAPVLPDGLPARCSMPAQASAATIVEHPLHPFSPRAFDPQLGGSRAGEWIAAAAALAAPVAQRAGLAGPVALPAGFRREAGATGARAAGSIAFDDLRAALSDPIAFWMRRRLGASMPRSISPTVLREPLWPQQADDRDLLGGIAHALLEGGDPHQIGELLRAMPRTAAGSVGMRQSLALLGQAEELVRRSGGATAIRSADIALTVADATVTARLPLPDPGGRQRFVSGFPLNMHAIVEAWLSHALLAAWLAAAPQNRFSGGDRPPPVPPLIETVLAAPDAVATVRIADPTGAIGHALAMTEALLAGPPPAAFPRAWLAARRKSRRSGSPAGRVGSAPGDGSGFLRALRDAIEGGPEWGGERDRVWQTVFWRDAAPDLRAVAADGDALWAPILDDVAIEEMK